MAVSKGSKILMNKNKVALNLGRLNSGLLLTQPLDDVQTI